MARRVLRLQAAEGVFLHSQALVACLRPADKQAGLKPAPTTPCRRPAPPTRLTTYYPWLLPSARGKPARINDTRRRGNR